MKLQTVYDVMVFMDHFHSSALFEYWTAFGQRWRLTKSSRYNSHNVIKIEQIDEQGQRISFEEPEGGE